MSFLKLLPAVACLVPLWAALSVTHSTVYYEAGRYGGWPANHGIWIWGNEIVVGFTEGTFAPEGHGRISHKDPVYDRQARSLDGGLTWKVESWRVLTPTQSGGPTAQPLLRPMDFRADNFALMFRFGDNNKGPSWFYYSADRCRTWNGPFTFPNFGRRGVSVRTDYQVIDRNKCLVFGSASKSNGMEGRPFVARTEDGGLTWAFVSWIGPEPKGYAIMPSTVRLPSGALLTAIRRKENGGAWIETFRSENDGRSWDYGGHAVPSTGEGSNPPSMLRLKDGRLSIVHGFRGVPQGIRARLSNDDGKTWGDEIVLRQDGTANDLGYVRSVQRPDGKIVAVYYFNGRKNKERTIEATIWDPGKR